MGRIAVTPAPAPMTVDEYLRTPETLLPQQLAFGILRVAESPLPRHQQAVFAIARALDTHVRTRRLGTVWISPLDVILDGPRALVVQPDLFFISNERAGIVRDRVRGAPDLMVEVLSPRPRIGDLDERLAWFGRYGVRECWVYRQPARSLEVHAFSAGGTRMTAFATDDDIRSGVLTEFRTRVGELTRDVE